MSANQQIESKLESQCPSWLSDWRTSSQVRILSIDGGGVRGMVPACGLVEIERRLAEAHKGSIHDVFDCFIGTSTGSLIAAALAKGMTADTIRNHFRRQARTIFPSPIGRLGHDWREFFLLPLRFKGLLLSKHGDQGLTQVLKEVLGDTTFGNIRNGKTKKRLMILTYSAGTRQPLLFDSESTSHDQVPVWEACRASCAAPTFLPEHRMQIKDGEQLALLDGGTVANNPAAIAICKALECRLEAESAFALSLGTGQYEEGFSPLRRWQFGGFLPWASTLVGTFMSGGNRMFENMADNLLRCDENHFRFDAPLWLARSGMDDASERHLNALEQDTRAYWSLDLTKKRIGKAIANLDSRSRPELEPLEGEWVGTYGDDSLPALTGHACQSSPSAQHHLTIEVRNRSFLRGFSRPDDNSPGYFEAGVVGPGILVGQWYSVDKSRASAFMLQWKSNDRLEGRWIGHGYADRLSHGSWTLTRLQPGRDDAELKSKPCRCFLD